MTLSELFATSLLSGMAESKSVAVVPLKGSNFPTWKVQCRMALMKEGLWGIVSGTENAPPEREADKRAKFVARRDKALAIIVLSVEPTLLYLLGDPEDPVAVWKKLSDQFQRKTWANKLELRRRLYALRLKEGNSVQEHIRKMIEIFEELAVVGDPLAEEDQVVYLLASLPESYSMLVTALEANAEVPKMETVTERLVHEERKQKGREGSGDGNHSKALMANGSGGGVKCFRCGKFGHIKRYCPERKPKYFDRRSKDGRHKANKADVGKQRGAHNSDSEFDAFVVSHALQASRSAGNWIIDSGASCHMCGDEKLFVNLKPLKEQVEVTLGDGHTLKVSGQGTVPLDMKLPDGGVRKCKLLDVLHVPALTYNLVSVSKAAESGITAKFDDDGCQIINSKQKVIAKGTRIGCLYYLDFKAALHADVATKDGVWHRRYGHLNVQSMQKLVREHMVEGFGYNPSGGVGDLCETCIGGKHRKTPWVSDSNHSRAAKPLDLVHSDVCGKLGTKSLGGGEYFLTFIDDCTHYTWVYILKHKDEVFKFFQEWKALVEKASGKKLKVLRTDNGGEFTSVQFEKFLRQEGIRHERTIPKTPQQNGIAERMNRTLVEMIHSMLKPSAEVLGRGTVYSCLFMEQKSNEGCSRDDSL